MAQIRAPQIASLQQRPLEIDSFENGTRRYQRRERTTRQRDAASEIEIGEIGGAPFASFALDPLRMLRQDEFDRPIQIVETATRFVFRNCARHGSSMLYALSFFHGPECAVSLSNT